MEKYYYVVSKGLTRTKGSSSSKSITKKIDPMIALTKDSSMAALSNLAKGEVNIKLESSGWESYFKARKTISKYLQNLAGSHKVGRSLKVKMLAAHQQGRRPVLSDKSYAELSEELSLLLQTLNAFIEHVELQMEETSNLTVNSSSKECEPTLFSFDGKPHRSGIIKRKRQRRFRSLLKMIN